MPAPKGKPVNYVRIQVKTSLVSLAGDERLPATAVYPGNAPVVDLAQTAASRSNTRSYPGLTQPKKLYKSSIGLSPVMASWLSAGE